MLDRDHPAGVKRGHMWAIVAREAEARFLLLHEGLERRALGPAAMLADFEGYLQSDEYSGLRARSPRRPMAHIVRLGCHMHSRRKFEAALDGGDVRAAIAMNLYSRQKSTPWSGRARTRGSTPTPERLRRIEQTEPLLRELKACKPRNCNPRLIPSSSAPKGDDVPDRQLGSADPTLSRVTARLADRQRDCRARASPRGDQPEELAVRRNRRGEAERAAVAFSVLATCRMQGVEPSAYIADVLRKLSAGWPMSRVDELLPDAWSRAKKSAENADAQ